MEFNTRMSTPLQKVFDNYALRIGVPVDQLRFEHWDEQCDWTIVKGDDTPSTIDMEADGLHVIDYLWARRLPLLPMAAMAEDITED